MGVRAGQGYGAQKPKRLLCPECGKKGVKQWYTTPMGCFRDCQYCQHTWGSVSWMIATDMRRVEEEKRALEYARVKAAVDATYDPDYMDPV